MKNIFKILWLLGVTFLVMVGTVFSQEIVKSKPSSHPHLNPNAQNAGDYHVISFMSRRVGKIGIQVLNRYEEPFYLGEGKIKAKITLENGKTENVWFDGEGYVESRGDEYGIAAATVYSKGFPWVKKAHSASLTVWIPLPDKKTYELTFTCKARESIPTHSGLNKKK